VFDQLVTVVTRSRARFAFTGEYSARSLPKRSVRWEHNLEQRRAS
jgi:hypothetical protein